MASISKFVDDFVHQKEQFTQIENDLGTLCKAKLEDQKIKFAWQSRVKEAESLKKKLQDRSHEYTNESLNTADIKDLVAGRVILTRWKDFGVVDDVIKANFNVRSHSQHPKSNQHAVTLKARFRGYDGLHFYVTRRFPEDQYTNLVIEIQVISVFMWAWTTLEHDILYKKLNGEPDLKLVKQIETLQGIANLGEVVLEQYDKLLYSDSLSPCLQPHDASLQQQLRVADFVIENKNMIPEESQLQQESRRIVSWVSEIDVESDHNQVRTLLGSRYEGSGQWFRQIYDGWMTSLDKPVFWIAGSVGTGKSSLVSSIIEWHFKRIRSKEKEKLVFFYCSRNHRAKTSSLEVLRSFIAQLAKSDDSLSISPLVKTVYEQRKNVPLKLDECSSLLARLANEHQQTTFIIDALDECDDTATLLIHLRHFWELTSGAKTSVKLFFSSRNQVEVCDQFPDCKKMELEKCNDERFEDMKVYIKTQVREREILRLGPRLLKGKCTGLEDRLIDVLVEHSQGMFLWVKLQLELFFGSKSRLKHEEDVKRKLDMLEKDGIQTPNKLAEVYEEIFNDNTEDGSPSRDVADRALKWMICAERPLLITQLAEAVSINDDETKREITVDYILQICSNFVISDESKTARFPHVSVREYLERYKYPLEQAHIQVAVTCLICLRDPQNRITDPKYIERFIFGYSAKFWIVHVAAIAPRDRSDLLQSLYARYLSINEMCSIMDWLEIIPYLAKTFIFNSDLCVKYHGAESESRNPLFAACVWGVVDMIPKESLTTAGLKELNAAGDSALLLASRFGHSHIVSLLIQKGAEIDLRSKRGTTALQTACYRGHNDIVRLLLDKGADIHAQGGDYGNALQAACFGGHNDIVRLLLDKGADIQAQSRLYGNALQTACIHGHEGVVRLLLDKGAEVNVQGGINGNALQAACFGGHKGVVLLLLDKGADINMQGGNYGNALQAACIRGHEGVVLLLLERGADINMQGGRYGNALQAACWEGHEGVVLLLLERGVDINAQGGNYGNALQAACIRGHEGVVLLLLERGADINMQGGIYGNALQPACCGGHEDIVQLLLERGAEVNVQGGEFGSALKAACYLGHEGIVRLLLDRGADVNAQGGKYDNVLQAACSCGHEGIVRLLLERGADINMQGRRYGNALQAACYNGHEDIVQLLLERGASVHAQGGKYGQLLQAACRRSHDGIARLLLRSIWQGSV